MTTYLLVLNGAENIDDEMDFNDQAAEWNALNSDGRGHFYFRWATGSTKRIADGDRIILVRVGSKAKIGDSRRGIVLYGVADGATFQDDHWLEEKYEKGIKGNYIKISPIWMSEWPHITITELERRYPTVRWAPQGSGPSIPDEIADEIWSSISVEAASPVLPSLDSDEVAEIGRAEVAPVDIAPELERRYRQVLTKHRLHQAQFRQNALDAARKLYGRISCYMCGFDAENLLEAAHVVPDANGGRASVDNAILLCPSHHRGLDAGYYEITKGTWPDWEILVTNADEDFATLWVDFVPEELAVDESGEDLL